MDVAVLVSEDSGVSVPPNGKVVGGVVVKFGVSVFVSSKVAVTVAGIVSVTLSGTVAVFGKVAVGDGCSVSLFG